MLPYVLNEENFALFRGSIANYIMFAIAKRALVIAKTIINNIKMKFRCRIMYAKAKLTT